MVKYYFYISQVEKYQLQERKYLSKSLKFYSEDKQYIEIDANLVEFFSINDEKVILIDNKYLAFYIRRDLKYNRITIMDFYEIQEVTSIPRRKYDIIDSNKILIGSINVSPAIQIFKTNNHLIFKNNKELVIMFAVLEVRSNVIVLR